MKRVVFISLFALVIAISLTMSVFATPDWQETSGRDLAEEQPIYDRLADVDPAAVPIFQEATQASDSGDLDAARLSFERVLSLVPESADAMRRLSNVLRRQGEYADAERLARQAYAIDPSPANADALALVLADSDDESLRAEALGLAKGAAYDLPDDAYVQYTLVMVAAANADTETLGMATQKLMQLVPDDPIAHYFAGLVAIERSQWGRAEAELLQARAFGIPVEAVDELMAEFHVSLMAGIWRGIALGSRIVLAWIVLMGLLYLVGIALSAVTLRSARRPHPQSTYRPGIIDRTLRGIYRGVIGLAVAYFYLSIPLLLFVMIALVGGSLYIFFYIGRIPVQVLAFIVVAGGATIYAVLRSVLSRVKADEPGKPLSRADAPALWNLVEEVALHVGTRPVDAIYLTGDTSMAVTERGGLVRKLSGRAQRCLILGIVCLGNLTQNELRSILAHEYGHFSNRDTAGGDLAWYVRVAIQMIAFRLEAKGLDRKYNPAWLFILGYQRAFLRITLGASRLQEILADRHAAVAYGGETFADSLQHIVRLAMLFHTQAAGEVNRALSTSQRLYNLYALPPIEGSVIQAELEKEFQETISRPTTPYDTHPATTERVQLIRQMEIEACLPATDGPSAGLLPNAEKWQWRFTAETQKRVDETYADLKTLTDSNQRLKAYGLRLSLAEQARDHGAEGAMLCSIADLFAESLHRRKALEIYQQALDACMLAGDRAGEAHVLLRRAVTHEDLEEPKEALSDYEKALELCLEAGDTLCECKVRFNLAMLLDYRGDVENAEEHLLRVIELEEASQDPDLAEDRVELERVHEKAEKRRADRWVPIRA